MMKATHIESKTYINSYGAVLIVTPDNSDGHDERTYDFEAEQVVDFLKTIFCNKTLKQIAIKMNPYEHLR